jgi:hypothetical protein
MKKIHKGDSSDSEYSMKRAHTDDPPDFKHSVVTILPHRMERDVETVKEGKCEALVETGKKRKYEVIGETVEINEVPTERDTITEDSTHGDIAKDKQALLPTTPLKQRPTGTPEIHNTKKNRSLEKLTETTLVTSEDSNRTMDVREHAKPLDNDDAH